MIAPKLRFSEFKDEWIKTRIGESFQLISGFAFPSSAKSNSDGAKWLKIADVGIQKMNPSNLSFLPKQYLQTYSNFIVKKDDYVVALTRPILNGELKISQVGDFYDNALLNQRVAKLASEDNNLKFIYCLLQKSETVKDIENSIAGTDPPNLSLNEIKDITISLPTVEEQTKIAEFLSAVDDKISQLSRQLELLNQYKKGVMQKIFSQEIRFKNDNGEDFGEWDLVTLGEITTDMQSGLSRKLNDSDTGLVVLRSNNIDKNSLDFTDIKYWYKEDPQGANVKNYLLEDGDILVNFINSLSQIGKTAIFYNKLNRDIICTTNILRLKVDKKRALNTFINFIFQTEEYINYIQSITKPAVNQASFTTKEFKLMEINLPTIQEQQKIAEFLTAIDERIDHTTAQLTHTKQWKKGLLQQMFV